MRHTCDKARTRTSRRILSADSLGEYRLELIGLRVGDDDRGVAVVGDAHLRPDVVVRAQRECERLGEAHLYE